MTVKTANLAGTAASGAAASRDEEARLAALQQTNLLDTDAEEAFDRITRTAAHAFGVPVALISLVDRNRQWFKSSVGIGISETSRDVSFCAHAILDGDVMVVPDATADPRFSDNPLVTGEPGIRFYAGAPLVLENGARIGTLCLLDRAPNTSFGAEDQRVLADLAAMAVVEINLRSQASMAQANVVRERKKKHKAQKLGTLLQQAISRSSIGFAVFNADERLVVCNNAYWALFNFRDERPETLPTFEELMRRQVEHEMMPEFENRDDDAKEAWVANRMAQFRAGDATITRQVSNTGWLRVEQIRLPGGEMLILGTDVSELKQQQEALMLSNTELERFAYVASHDLQEPLRKIRTFTGILNSSEAKTLSVDGRETLGRVMASAERMQTLIQDLLSFSRLQTDDRPLEPVDLGRTLCDVLADMEDRIADTGAVIDATDLPVIEADPVQMHQLLQNLVGNALKFSKPDATPEIKVSWQDRPENPGDATRGGVTAQPWCTITIEDNGIGFEAKHSEAIFQAFHRLHGKTAFAGSGIGLAICRRVVDRLHGDIRVESSPGAGAIFTVTLPSRQTVGDRHG